MLYEVITRGRAPRAQQADRFEDGALLQGPTRVLRLPVPCGPRRVVRAGSGDHGAPGSDLLRVLQPGRVDLWAVGREV